MILAIRSDNPLVYIGLLSTDGTELASRKWEAGREFSAQILQTIDELLDSTDGTVKGIEGIIVYQGPGSYTGLRISISVCNALAYSNNVAIVGATGEKWLQDGINALASTQPLQYVSPEYGGEVKTTKPRK